MMESEHTQTCDSYTAKQIAAAQMNYAENAQVQMHGMAAGAAIGGQISKHESRTFDGLSDAVTRVRATSSQVARMLNRTVLPTPTPREVPSAGLLNQALARPPYVSSIERLHAELSELGSLLDQLEKHI